MTTPNWIFKMTTREWRRFNVYYDELKGCLFANGIISGLPKEGLEVIELAAYEGLQAELESNKKHWTKMFTEAQVERDGARAALEDRDNMHAQQVQALTAQNLRLQAEIVGLKQMFESLNKHVLPGEVDSVDSARRVLGEIEQLRTHNEALKSTLVGINLGGERISKRLALRERQLERMEESLKSIAHLNLGNPTPHQALKDIEEMGK